MPSSMGGVWHKKKKIHFQELELMVKHKRALMNMS